MHSYYYARGKYPKIAWMIEYIVRWIIRFDDFEESVKAGKFSPEAKRFTSRKLGLFIEKLKGFKELFEESN